MNKVWIPVLRNFMFLSAVSPRFFLVLDPTGRLGGLRGTVGSACKEFEDNEGNILAHLGCHG